MIRARASVPTLFMNPDWQDFLQQQHAHIEDSVAIDFGDAPAELAATQSATVLCDMGQFSMLKVSGEDAQTFLQNLLSSDVAEVSPLRTQASSLNTPKGRMLATFLIWQRDTDYFLHLPTSLVTSIHKKLSMYVLRSKVKIADASAEHVCLGVSGPHAATLLQNIFGALPQQPLSMQQYADDSVICGGPLRYQVNTTPQRAPELWQKLSAGARPVGSPCWDWLNIRAGVPVILPATQEQFVPQMVNFELLGGVGFKKGCYPGQEIVARMQYLGKLKRRMYLAHIESEIAPQAGDEVFSTEMEGQPSGMVVNASLAPGGGYDLLTVVQIESREKHEVHLKSLQGAVLQFQPLPYAV